MGSLLPGMFPTPNATFLALVEFRFTISGITSSGKLGLKVPRDRWACEKETGTGGGSAYGS